MYGLILPTLVAFGVYVAIATATAAVIDEYGFFDRLTAAQLWWVAALWPLVWLYGAAWQVYSALRWSKQMALQGIRDTFSQRAAPQDRFFVEAEREVETLLYKESQ